MLCAWRVRPVICLWQYDRYQCNSESKPGDFDHAQSEETDPQAIATTTDNRKLQYGFCSPISQFVIVGRCRNHLANPLSRSTSSRIWRGYRRYLSQFQRCNYFRFWGHIYNSGCRSELYLLANIISHIFMVLHPSVVGILTVPFAA